jgi:hypothetical protein
MWHALNHAQDARATFNQRSVPLCSPMTFGLYSSTSQTKKGNITCPQFITVAYGDGIGPEIMEATLHILKEAGAKLAPKNRDW